MVGRERELTVRVVKKVTGIKWERTLDIKVASNDWILRICSPGQFHVSYAINIPYNKCTFLKLQPYNEF